MVQVNKKGPKTSVEHYRSFFGRVGNLVQTINRQGPLKAPAKWVLAPIANGEIKDPNAVTVKREAALLLGQINKAVRALPAERPTRTNQYLRGAKTMAKLAEGLISPPSLERTQELARKNNRPLLEAIANDSQSPQAPAAQAFLDQIAAISTYIEITNDEAVRFKGLLPAIAKYKLRHTCGDSDPYFKDLAMILAENADSLGNVAKILLQDIKTEEAAQAFINKYATQKDQDQYRQTEPFKKDFARYKETLQVLAEAGHNELAKNILEAVKQDQAKKAEANLEPKHFEGEDVFANAGEVKPSDEQLPPTSPFVPTEQNRHYAEQAWEEVLSNFENGNYLKVIDILKETIKDQAIMPSFPVALEKRLVPDHFKPRYEAMVAYFTNNREGVPGNVLTYLGITPETSDVFTTVRKNDSDPISLVSRFEGGNPSQHTWNDLLGPEGYFTKGDHNNVIRYLDYMASHRELFDEFPSALNSNKVDPSLVPLYSKLVQYFSQNRAGVSDLVLAFLGIDSLPPLPPPAGPEAMHDLVGDNINPSMTFNLTSSMPAPVQAASVTGSENESFAGFFDSEPTVLPARPSADLAEPATKNFTLPQPTEDPLANQLNDQTGHVTTTLAVTLKTAESELAGLQASLEAMQRDLQKFNADILYFIESLQSEQARAIEENQHFSPEKAGVDLQASTEQSYKNESIPPKLADTLLPKLAADPRLVAINRRHERWNRSITETALEIETTKNDAAAWQAERQGKIALLQTAIAKQETLIKNLSRTIKDLSV